MERIVLGLTRSHGFEPAMADASTVGPLIEISKITSRARLSASGGSRPWSQRNMPLTTTEVPTFFGPSDSPLFGVVHLPVDNQIRGGVLICGSLGKEGMDSFRLHRILADGLARRGFGVLRFDYLGLGDSAYAQGRDDAVANWVASVGHALDYLALIGAESATAIGIRAGCLILDEYLAQSHTVNRVVYLDPYGAGRRYLREHTALYRVSVGEDAATPGEVSVIGGRLSNHAAAEFAALRMGDNPVSAHGVGNVLLVGRPAETDKRVTALASAQGVDAIITGGLPECSRPREVLLPIPFAAVDSITEWIDGNVPTRTHRAVPQYLTTVTMPAEGPDGVDVVESIERIEPNGLFTIRTQPRDPRPAPAKTVLFFVTAVDLHVGPAREWVELSRRIAAAGSQAVRWDLAGLGLSRQIRRDPFRRLYSKADITDSIAVARHACRDAGKLELVGICSGAWYAAHAARNIGAQSAILINPLVWNWRITPTMLQQWDARKKTLQAGAASDTGGGPSESRTTRRLKALLNAPREPTKSFMHNHLPRYILRALRWVGLVWLPEDVLAPLAQRGTDVTLIASPEDEEQFTARGGRAAFDRLQWTSQPPRLIATPTGDHAAHHPAILAAIRNAVLPVAAVCPSEHMPVSEITSSPNALVANRSHLPKGCGTVIFSTGYTVCPERDHHHGGGVA
jgi:alpha-beta hydrolase superfamily lysophospholipase